MMVRNTAGQEAGTAQKCAAAEAAERSEHNNTYPCCFLVKHGVSLAHLALVERPQLVARHNDLAHVQLQHEEHGGEKRTGEGDGVSSSRDERARLSGQKLWRQKPSRR